MRKSGMMMLMSLLIMSIMLVGCFQGEQSLEEMDLPPGDAIETEGSVTDEETDEDGQVEKDEQDQSEETDVSSETVPRQLYLLDVNNMLVPQTIELPKPESKEVAAQVVEYLVKGGPITPLLPNGFQAVLPEGTEVLGMNLQEDGTLIVDLSEEFTNYRPEEELLILESLTYTLTQFDTVERIKLMINGELLTEMPVNGTPIASGYSRANGINLIDTDTIDFITSSAVTMYFPAEFNDNRYYVPVTAHVDTSDGNLYRSIVQALIDGPGYQQKNMVHVFNSHSSLVDEPILHDGVLQLVFNENILKDVETAVIADEVMETLVRTFTSLELVEAVDVKVENVEVLKNENGEAYSEPVTQQLFLEDQKL